MSTVQRMRLAAVLLLTALLAAGEPGTPFTPSDDVLGRPGFIADNGLLAVGVSPLGARVLRLDLAGRALLWTDRAAVAAMRPPSGDGDEMWWFKGRGGAFLWPTPQAHWRRSDAPFQGWPPPPAIERGQMLAGPGATGLDLHGPAERNPLWRSLGMQPSYRLMVPPHQARLRIHATWTTPVVNWNKYDWNYERGTPDQRETLDSMTNYLIINSVLASVTPPDAIILSRKPMITYFLSGRKSVPIIANPDPAFQWEYIQKNRVTHLVTGIDENALVPVFSEVPKRFKPLAGIDNLAVVYRILRRHQPLPPEGEPDL